MELKGKACYTVNVVALVSQQRKYFLRFQQGKRIWTSIRYKEMETG